MIGNVALNRQKSLVAFLSEIDKKRLR